MCHRHNTPIILHQRYYNYAKKSIETLIDARGDHIVTDHRHTTMRDFLANYRLIAQRRHDEQKHTQTTL